MMSRLNKIQTRLSRTFSVLRTGQVAQANLREIPPITVAEVAEAREFFPMDKFFMYGHARSGTTLLARLVRLHPEIHCNWQGHFFSREPMLTGMASEKRFADWLARKSNRWNRGTDMTPVALRAMADFILERDARKAGANIVGDKSPNVLTNGVAVKETHRIYPDGKVIFIVRDGRDTLISHRFQNFIDGSQFLPKSDLAIRDDFARNPDPYFAGEKSIFTPKAMRRMAAGWVANIVGTHQAGLDIFGEQYYVLKYEDLVDQPYPTVAKLWTFLGADPAGLEDMIANEMESNPDADWQKQKASALVVNLNKGKRGSWKDLFTMQDKILFKEIAGQTLIDWQYEQGMDW